MTAPAITLRAVTRDNFDAVIGLRVADDQTHFVASNEYSLAEAYVESQFYPFAIYAGDEPVGFTMYGFEEPTGRWWIVRLMIAHAQQGKGFGRRAMELLIPLMTERHRMDSIVTAYEPGNDVAASLYRSLGFVDTGEMDDDEHLMRLNVRDWGVEIRD
jgi:diamine N-acetyltransferase